MVSNFDSLDVWPNNELIFFFGESFNVNWRPGSIRRWLLGVRAVWCSVQGR